MKNDNRKKIEPMKVLGTGEEKRILNVIRSPTKLKILGLLEKKEMTSKEIVNLLAKAKSTISVHMQDLEDKNIISHRISPQDKRKKIFYLNSEILGEIDHIKQKELKEQKVEYLIENLIEPREDNTFSRLMFHTLRANLIQSGISLDPVIYETGLKIGLVAYQCLKTDDFNKFIDNIVDFWTKHKLGKMECSFNTDKIVIKNTECFECELLPKTGQASCYMEMGILKSLFSQFFSENIKINETKCFAKGDDYCLFEVEKEKKQNIRKNPKKE